MVIFELTMPNRGSWNGKWSGDRDVHIIKKRNNSVPKQLIGKSFCYTWDDGWIACVSVRSLNVNTPEYRSLIKNNRGFCGYDWMVESILKYGKIITPREWCN